MQFEHAPMLQRSDIGLRPLRQSDAEAWYDYLRLPQVYQHTSWNLQAVADLLPLLQMNESDEPQSPIRFALLDGERLIGTVGFHTRNLLNRSAELAYDLHPDYWGRGIARAAVQAACAWYFEHLGAHRLQATTLHANLASQKVLAHCGFQREGCLRGYRMVRGQPMDFWSYSLLVTDVAASQPNPLNSPAPAQ